MNSNKFSPKVKQIISRLLINFSTYTLIYTYIIWKIASSKG